MFFQEYLKIENRYMLVRAALAITNYYGALRVCELKDIKYGGRFIKNIVF